MINQDKNNENPNITIAREISQKFEFYFIALVFTVLALSIQTSSFTKIYFQYLFEIFAWCCFLISGLAGLSRLEWLPIAYRHHGSQDIEKNNLSAVNEGIHGRPILDSTGGEWTDEQLQKSKRELEEQIAKRNKKIEMLEMTSIFKYKIHKWSFVIGLISLIVSRTIINLRTVFQI